MFDENIDMTCTLVTVYCSTTLLMNVSPRNSVSMFSSFQGMLFVFLSERFSDIYILNLQKQTKAPHHFCSTVWLLK